MTVRANCSLPTNADALYQPTSYGLINCTPYLRSWGFHAEDSIPCGTVWLVLCLQTVQPRLWCRDSYGTATRESRWESMGTQSEHSNVTLWQVVPSGLSDTVRIELLLNGELLLTSKISRKE